MLILKLKVSRLTASFVVVSVRVAAVTAFGLSCILSLSQLRVINVSAAWGLHSRVERCSVSVVLPVFFMYNVLVTELPGLMLPQSTELQRFVADGSVNTCTPTETFIRPPAGMVC